MGKKRSVEVLLLLLPILFGVTLVWYFGVNVVYWDEWETVRLYNSIVENGISFSRLFEQHNEHRILFPNIIFLASGILTEWNVKFQMYISQVMVACMYILFALYMKRGRQQSEDIIKQKTPNWLFVLFTASVGISCFSAVQWQNFLWGFQIGFVLVAFSAVSSLYFFQRGIETNVKKHYIFAIIMAVISTFSSMQGLSIWAAYFVSFILYFIFCRDILNKKMVTIYIFISIIAMCLYLNDYSSVGDHPKLFGNRIIELIKFYLVLIGSMGFSLNIKIAMLVGCMELFLAALLLIWLIIRKRLNQYFFPISLILYSYAVLGTIAIGRGGFGIEQALSSRYTTYALLSFIGILMIAYKEYLNIKGIIGRKAFFLKGMGVLMAIIFTFICFENVVMIVKCNSEKKFREKIQGVLLNYESNTFEDLRWIYPWKDYKDAYATIRLLEKYKFNVFSKSSYTYQRADNGILSNMKKVDLHRNIGFDKNTVKWDNKFFYINDPWAEDFTSNNTYQEVYVRVNNDIYKTASHFYKPYVAKIFNNKAFTKAEFRFTQKNDILNQGENKISAVVILKDGKSYYETEQVSLYKDSDGNISK